MRWLVLFTLVFQLPACISLPDIYLIDRHTAMEAEASGEWPQLEQRFRQQVPTMGPTNLAKEPSQRRRERAFRILNGEFPATPSDRERQVQ
jgi:hypothetical protein